jgi:hypothetical protein
VDTFQKILVAKFSPKNRCNVPEGEVLTVRPRKTLPHNKDVGHYFIGTRHISERARYGWVADVHPFTLDEFVRDYLGGRDLSQPEREHLQTLLSSISRLPAETPVTATYFVRGVIEKRTAFTVHKVIFHQERQEKKKTQGT